MIVLDTHIFVWWNQNDSKLTSYHRELTKSEVRSQKSEVVFVTGIYAPLQKHFALKGGVLDPFFFDNLREKDQVD